ncbi:MAG: ABC transporter substrate-binding protein [Clostridia bacterium]|nr:ABC transporter substrate-binding protein [Clostridia bacterium]
MKSNVIRKTLSALIALVIAALALASCGTAGPSNPAGSSTAASSAEENPAGAREHLKIGTLSGPTGMGMAKLFADEFYKEDIELYTAPDAVRADLLTGKLDIAAVPANLAAVIFNKTEGEYLVAAINTLGVLYVVSRNPAVTSLQALSGIKLYATGQGSTPEYILNKVLSASQINPSEIEYKTEHSELASLLLSGAVDTALLPQPFVTTVTSKDSTLKAVIDLSEEWSKYCDGDAVQGVLVVSKKAVEEHKSSVDAFLDAYKESVDFVNGSHEEAGKLISGAGIVASAELAAAAIPGCHIVFIDGAEMKSSLSGFLNALYEAAPASVGGKLPGDGLCYER